LEEENRMHPNKKLGLGSSNISPTKKKHVSNIREKQTKTKKQTTVLQSLKLRNRSNKNIGGWLVQISFWGF